MRRKTTKGFLAITEESIESIVGDLQCLEVGKRNFPEFVLGVGLQWIVGEWNIA